MDDTTKQILFVSGLMLVGTIAGIFWYAHGGQWWLIPLLAIGVPIVLFIAGCVFFILNADWSH